MPGLLDLTLPPDPNSNSIPIWPHPPTSNGTPPPPPNRDLSHIPGATFALALFTPQTRFVPLTIVLSSNS